MTAGRLDGRRVLVTRGEAKTDRLSGMLEAEGATVLWVPLIATEVLPGAARLPGELATLRNAPRAGWLVLTSAVAADLAAQAAGGASLGGVRVAVVGTATAGAARARGADVALIAAGGTAAALGNDLAALVTTGDPVLLVAAAGGRDAVAPPLRRAGAEVRVVTAYRSVCPEDAPPRLAAALASGELDAVIFTSGSTVRHFDEARADAPLPACPAVCIGPETAAQARESGWREVLVAEPHTAPGVVAAVVAATASRQPLP